RNVSDGGAFEAFRGDRIPNRPYLFANGSLRFRESHLFVDGDSLTARWESRYVHSYYRGWESVGREKFKKEIPSQWLQSPSVTYAVENDGRALSATLEVQNLTDVDAFDFFGVQKPGRAVYFKATVEL
ncbi:MAG: ligand-gated channel protein, partial [Bradymonadaceae bacterium]